MPGPGKVWGKCRFIFDRDERNYDWLVVYDDLPSKGGERRSLREEALACQRQNTLLVTTEPSSVKAYGSTYVSQFGCVLTSQEQWALPHRDRIYSQPALRWFYGIGTSRIIPYKDLVAQIPMRKTCDVSMVWSGKKGRYTWLRRRYDFMCRIRKDLAKLDVFGRGIRALDDKAEALNDYRYHIAIENHVGLHHWTEKLSDPFLGFSLPFYYGCPNVREYFPEQSFIEIDITNYASARDVIVDAIQNKEYEKRFPYILEARRRVLDEYNLMAVLSREIEARHGLENELRHASKTGRDVMLLSRYAIRKKYPFSILQQAYEKSRARVVHGIKSIVRG